MIRTFFKENAVWYWSYALLSALFLIVFALYHLPIVYFVISFLLNLTILSFITLWQYQCFKHKINTLQQFIYVNELDTLQLPSELAYKDGLFVCTSKVHKNCWQSRLRLKMCRALSRCGRTK